MRSVPKHNIHLRPPPLCSSMPKKAQSERVAAGPGTFAYLQSEVSVRIGTAMSDVLWDSSRALSRHVDVCLGHCSELQHDIKYML